MKKLTTWLLFLFLVISLIPTFSPIVKASPSTWYVSPTGSDGNTGDILHPFKTLQKAINESSTSDAIYLREGNYNDVYNATCGWRLNQSGTPSAWFTLAGYPGERAVLNGAGHPLENGYALLRIGKRTEFFSYIRITNLVIENVTTNSTSSAGILAGAGSTGANHHIRIDNCTIQNCRHQGLVFKPMVSSTAYPVNNITVENCTINNTNTDPASMHEGVTFSDCEDISFHDNIIMNCSKAMLDLASNTKNGKVFKNTFITKVGAGIYLDGSQNNSTAEYVSNISIYGNLFCGVGQTGLKIGCEFIGGCNNITVYNNIFNMYNSTTGSQIGIKFERIDNYTHWFADITIKYNTISIGKISYPLQINFKRNELKNISVVNNIFQSNSNASYQISALYLNSTDSCVHFSHNIYNHTTKPAETKWSDGNKFEASAIKASPQFFNRIAGDFHLTVSSPAIDAADSTYTVSTDYDGHPRPQNGSYDIGAYEYCNHPPVFGNTSPVNGLTGNPLSFSWSIPINDPDGDAFNWTIECNNGQKNGITGATNGTKSLSLTGLTYSTTYTIWVNATDLTGSGLYTRNWYTFTTRAIGNNPPVFGTPSPANGSTGNSLSFSWGIPISDPGGDQFSWTIQCNNGQSSGGSDELNETKLLSLSGLTNSMIYKVWVNATDPTGSGNYTRKWFTFTTKRSGDGGGGGGGGDGDETSNKKPIANASAGEPYQGYVDSEITFDGSRSIDPDGNITKWLWNFGDNTNGSGKTIRHTYSKTGTYTVTLTVTDNEGATNTNTTTCVITKPSNRPPATPIITGPINGTKNTMYTYTTLSTDADNDTIQYSIIWGDQTSYANISTFLASGTPFNCSHSWTVAGRYNVTVTVTDNQTTSSSKITVFIDTLQTRGVGYLIDNNGDGIYDTFYSDVSKQITTVQNKDGNYNIDSNGDGEWDYTFDVIKGFTSYQESNTSWLESNSMTVVIVAIVIIGIIGFILLWKKGYF